ncbi:putative ATP-dependent RNA helicase DHX37 [Babylonia areolata]|uniref:putative ATP-dependent RNA helicase DHX37 n=1 Tax=Babylonia areolata TaxID=304850 RepID=UPI003FD31BFE
MGKKKLGHNWKARAQFKTDQKSSDEPQVTVEIGGASDGAGLEADNSNALVLPGRKRKKEKVEEEGTPKVRKLTKKERKRLEKIKTVKEKKAKRAELLEKLQGVQATEEEMKLFTSIAEVHAQKFRDKLSDTKDSDKKPVYTVRGSNKKRKANSAEMSDEDEEQQSEAESIDTSDISTDEESEEEGGKEKREEGGKDMADSSGPTSTSTPGQETKEALSSATSTPSQEAPNAPSVSVDAAAVNTAKEGATNNGTASKGKEGAKRQMTTPAVHVPVYRKPDIEAARLKLPISGEEQAIVEMINENAVTIVSGETGSGKTTQVPQFLYEAGYAHGGGLIGVTEPRRVAAISMARRVAEELNLSSREVSYQIRYEGNVTPDTRIKFMTDGVLLREIQQDFVLSKYSVIILDEAHERSVFTDILIGLLSRIAPYRIKRELPPLKLVIMSATLDKVGFLQNPRLFRTRPADIDVAARQFPVHVHFAARTEEDYLAAAFRKTCEIHQNEPPGGVLIFVTGQQEVMTLCRKLKKTFPYKKEEALTQADPHESRKQRKRKVKEAEQVLPEVDLSKYSSAPVEDDVEEMRKDAANVDTADIDDFDLDEDAVQIADQGMDVVTKEPLWVLPLYSLLSSHKQSKVFEAPPPGCRLCVVATNVAETSLTIPNITYVVDTGKTKTKFYDKVTGVSTFKITWTSKASASQRTGRAGRVGPGKCYRLYSSAMYKNHFEEHTQPEMSRRPVDDLVLQMKAMGISKVVNFPFPTPPDCAQIQVAEKLLLSLGALEVKQGAGSKVKGKKEEATPTITALGHTMAQYPVAPRYARMLAATTRADLLPYIIIAVAALSVDELFVDFQNADKEDEDAKVRKERIKKVKKIWTDSGQSQQLGDVAMLVKAVGACESQGMTFDFCAKYGIRYKAMQEVRKLRHQLTKEVNLRVPGLDLCIDPALAPPTDQQMLELRKIMATGMADHVARLCVDPVPDAKGQHRNPYQCAEIEDLVYIHPTSALYKQKKEFVVYQHIHITSRPYMKGVVGVEAHWLPELAPYHCQRSKPLQDPPPSWGEDCGKVMCHMKCTFGSRGWPLGEVRLEYPPVPERYAWFAQFLLEGRVVAPLAKYTPLLLSPPSTMTKSWARLQPRTEAVKKALMARGVHSRQGLLDEWKDNPQFLLQAYLQWVPESVQWQVTDSWPPLSSE